MDHDIQYISFSLHRLLNYSMEDLLNESEKIQAYLEISEAKAAELLKSADRLEALTETLRELPTKLSYRVMIPFGPKAFAPGKLIHTNELTVHLGADIYAERFVCNFRFCRLFRKLGTFKAFRT